MDLSLKFTVLLFSLTALLGACSSNQVGTNKSESAKRIAPEIPGIPKPALALVPQARTYTGEIAPVIRDILPHSVAQNFNFKLGDQIVRLNGELILSATQFDQKIKRAPQNTTIVFKRNGRYFTNKVILGQERPRFGAGFEPEGVALVKKLSPFVSFMHQKEFTIFAETSVNENQTILHVNAILKSTKPLTVARIKYSVYDRGTKTSIGTGTDQINALGSDSRIFKKAFHKGKGFKGPISVALDVEGKRFHFEFQ